MVNCGIIECTGSGDWPQMVDIIYCAAGNRRFAEIAIRHRFLYGAQLPNTVHYCPVFADQNWRKPDRGRYIASLEEHRPRLATVLDYEDESQHEEVMEWADAASRYVTEAVIIIPKAFSTIDRIPEKINGVSIRLGYSVPTRFSGTSVPVWEFNQRPVHLLGGSPSKQYTLSSMLNVKSADGNYAQKMANNCQFFVAGGSARYAKNRYWPMLNESVYGQVDNDVPYLAFELSCMNIMNQWRGHSCMIRFAVEADLPHIKKIANQYGDELGYVMWPSLRRAIERRELWVAAYGMQVIGFVNWHLRLDGWATVYELAVKRDFRGTGIGAALIASIPHSLQLKCTVDNTANEFYEKQGFIFIECQAGRKRELNFWRRPGEIGS